MLPTTGSLVKDSLKAVRAFRKIISTKLSGLALGFLVVMLSLVTANPAYAQTEIVLHAFTGGRQSSDGAAPYAGPALYKGKLYGTTQNGGIYGYGTVYAITRNGDESVLYNFSGGGDGGYPIADVIFDKDGNLHSTSGGGTSQWGAVFSVSPNGAETVNYSFTGKPDGGQPEAGLTFDKEGNLYGTTFAAGAHGYGSVFKIDPSGAETILYSFTGKSDGGYPHSRLLLHGGKLYGTTTGGGAYTYGTVFELTLSGTEAVLHSFTGGADGGVPNAGVTLHKGNFYGTTAVGGVAGACSAFGPPGGCGTIFEISKTGKENVLYSFTGGADGALPIAGLVVDRLGNLYGTTAYGGASGTCMYACGTVFVLASSGAETVLHSFVNDGTDGYYPRADLVLDSKGNIYGTTTAGGGSTDCDSGCGVVFKVTR